MSKITGSFVILVFVIFFSSVVYIWQSDAEKRTLESQIATQTEEIDTLKSQLEQKDTPADTINTGSVEGVSTETGILTGSVKLSGTITSEAIIICANETHSKLETCLDVIIEENKNSYDFELELPQGTYEVYAVTPPLENKKYYSEVSVCDENGNCETDESKKRLIQVTNQETQSNINIYL